MAKKPAKTKPVKKQAPPAKKKAAPAAAKSKKTTKPAPAGKAKAAKPAKKSAPKPAAKVVKKATKPAAPAKKVVKPAKPAAKAKVAAKPAPKAKPVKKEVAKKVAKVVKPAPKAAPKAAPKVVAKPAAKSAPKPAAKPAPAKKVEEVKKPAPVAKENKKEEPVAKPVQPEVKKAAAPAPKEAPAPKAAEKPKEAEEKKAPLKTVEQQLQEKAVDMPEAGAKASGKSKEDLFVPKYQLPTTIEARPMRPKPPTVLTDAPVKPVANPIYVPPAPDGKPGIKFAPIAIVEKPKEKEKPNKSEEDDMSSKTSPRLAFNESDDKKGISVEAKLRALYGIQLIDSRIDKIHAMRGELPLEVQDLEDDVAGFEARINNLNEDLKNLTEEITSKKNGIKNSEALIKKYKEQLNNVKNNREFDSLNKEIEFQELEIQLHNKRIKEFEAALKGKQDILETTTVKLTERANDLQLKKTELNEIVASTEKEEKLLRQKSDEAKKLIEERLLSAYERIRSGAPNGMAVVPIEREASAGSFIQLPPQKQLDVAARKRVIVDEHSGRILVDADLAREEQEKMDGLLATEL